MFNTGTIDLNLNTMLSPDQDVDYWSDENLPPEVALNKDAKRRSGIPEWIDIFDKKWVRGYLPLCDFDDGERIVAVSLISSTILYVVLCIIRKKFASISLSCTLHATQIQCSTGFLKMFVILLLSILMKPLDSVRGMHCAYTCVYIYIYLCIVTFLFPFRANWR